MDNVKYNHYEVLGLASTATPQEIEEACLRLAKKYHPDTNPGDALASRNFAQIEAIYETLGTPQKRNAYDAQLGSELLEGENRPRSGGYPTATAITVEKSRWKFWFGVGAFGIAIGALTLWFFIGQPERLIPLISTSKVSSKPAQEAYSALRKLEAATESGVNIGDYTKHSAEVWYQVKLFLESTDAKQNPDIAAAFSDAIVSYRRAAALWRITIEEPDHSKPFPKGKVPLWAQRIRIDFPDLDKFMAESHDETKDKYFLKEGIQECWSDASKSLKSVAVRFQ